MAEEKIETVPGLSFETPEWAKYMKEGDFISHFPSYKSGPCIDLFDEYSFPDANVGDIRYYVFDPVKNGADPDGQYPVVMFLHGMGNSLDGKIVINYSMAEFYASEEYQKTMGGAYLIVPLANEVRNEMGQVEHTWGPDYVEPIMNLKRKFYEDHAANAGKSFFMGTSAGGFFVWEMLKTCSREMEVAVVISGGNIPEDTVLDEICANGTKLLVMHGRHDEMVSFEKEVASHLEKLESLENVTLFLPEWVRNGDGGVAQLNPWIEMGQHCLCNQVTANLLYDDKTSYEPEIFPDGMTGWIRDNK